MNSNRDDDDAESINSHGEFSFATLVQLARAGDLDARGRLIENYRNYLLFLANEDVGPVLKAKMGASDAVQESMLHAQVHLGQFAGETEAEFKAWLRTILINDIHKARRKYSTQKRNVNQEINLQEQSAVGRGLQDDRLTPSSEAIQNEKEDALREAILRLSPDQQQVIQLRNFEQLSFEEIGKQMNRGPDAARKMWARTIEVLKSGLHLGLAGTSDDQAEHEAGDG